jgi:FAD-dependent urate hydroxylase
VWISSLYDLKEGELNSERHAGSVLKEIETERTSGSPDYDVVIIGAGPYGLATAAHLKAKGLRIRVFGEPMEFWSRKMPQGMLLRSPRVASNISDPQHTLTLEAYEAASGTAPQSPLPLETFIQYGMWFQQQLGNEFDRRSVLSVKRNLSGFELVLKDGSYVTSTRVVVAAGIGPFRRVPQVFRHLPSTQVTHCYEGKPVSEFPGTRVAVIGAGQSALESAAILHEAGATVEVIAKSPQLRWIGMHSWLYHLGPISKALYSSHDVGPAGISRLVAAPKLVARIPLKMRDKIRKRAVRAAGSRWLPERMRNIKVSTGRTVESAKSLDAGLELTLDDGTKRVVDHVLLGTGYDVDISRYPFLSPELLQEVQQFEGYPKLKGGFRSSVPGLHFVGATAARSFGPLLYFVAGTEFAARELTSHIVRNRVAVR